MKLQCLHCHEVFEETDSDTRSFHEGTSEAWGVRMPMISEYMACPRCGSTDLQDHAHDEDDCCGECQEIVVKVENHLPERRVA